MVPALRYGPFGPTQGVRIYIGARRANHYPTNPVQRFKCSRSDSDGILGQDRFKGSTVQHRIRKNTVPIVPVVPKVPADTLVRSRFKGSKFKVRFESTVPIVQGVSGVRGVKPGAFVQSSRVQKFNVRSEHTVRRYVLGSVAASSMVSAASAWSDASASGGFCSCFAWGS